MNQPKYKLGDIVVFKNGTKLSENIRQGKISEARYAEKVDVWTYLISFGVVKRDRLAVSEDQIIKKLR